MGIEKLTNLSRAGRSLAPAVLHAYVNKAVGRKQTVREFALLSYYNLLIDCELHHSGEFEQGFIFKTRDGLLLHARKPPSSDFTVFRQIWKDREYLVAINALRKHVRKGAIKIIDAGANAGYSTVYLMHHLQPDFIPHVVCIEPAGENVDLIKRNIHINRLKNVVVEQAGLFHKSCFLEVSNDFRDGKDWSLQVEESLSDTGLKSVEISDLLEKNGWREVDFLKIDIEGAERYLFEDPEYAKSFLQKVRIISIEIHHEYGTENNILKILKDNNFSYTQTGEITLGLNNSLLARN